METPGTEHFSSEVELELARKRRLGGFVSVCVLGLPGGSGETTTRAASIEQWWSVLRAQVRAYDVLGVIDNRYLGILMPDTAITEAVRGAQRLLGLASDASASDATPSAGVASAYGDTEGGARALIEAATNAVETAGRGEVVTSRTVRGEPRLLVVDDDAVFAAALAETISQHGWVGHPCSEPADAMERVRSNEYQGLFVDLVLPSASGVDILRVALAHSPRRPAILMSGNDADHGAVLDALALGPVMFVRKPLAPQDLDAALRMFRVLLPGARPR